MINSRDFCLFVLVVIFSPVACGLCRSRRVHIVYVGRAFFTMGVKAAGIFDSEELTNVF